MKASALQQAVYDRLNTSAITDLLSAVYGPLPAIFTRVPEQADSGSETAFPFITIGADTITPYNTKDGLGGSAVVQIDAWARSASMLGIKALADAIDARMNRGALSISGATHITTELESSVISRDPDGKTLRALMLYRVLYLNT